MARNSHSYQPHFQQQQAGALSAKALINPMYTALAMGTFTLTVTSKSGSLIQMGADNWMLYELDTQCTV